MRGSRLASCLRWAVVDSLDGRKTWLSEEGEKATQSASPLMAPWWRSSLRIGNALCREWLREVSSEGEKVVKVGVGAREGKAG